MSSFIINSLINIIDTIKSLIVKVLLALAIVMINSKFPFWLYKNVEANVQDQKFDSDFEIDVFKKLKKELKANSKVFLATQFNVGTFKIDIVVLSESTNQVLLGIEVDGYKYHNGFEAWSKDIERQKHLEAKGYIIYRITKLSWKHNYKDDIKKINQLLVIN